MEDNIKERYELAIQRIKEIAKESGQGFFKKVADFILMTDSILEDGSLSQLKQMNYRLYEDVIGDNYNRSYANPDVAVAEYGKEIGRLLSFLYMEIRGMIVYAVEKRRVDMTIVAELFIQVYCMFEEEVPSYKELHETIYWYVSDYCDTTIEYRIRELVDPSLDFATRIIMESDLSNPDYLYAYGEYVTENEIKTAKFLAGCSQEEIHAMAQTFVDGYRIGFELGNKDLSKKQTVNIRYCLGFERIVKAEIEAFEKLHLKPVIYRAAVNSVNKRMHIRTGYYGAIPNKQMDYDHRFDSAIYMDKPFCDRKAAMTRVAYEKYKQEAGVHGGPAVMEVFGEIPFEPVNKTSVYTLDGKQQKLSTELSSELGRITNEYIKGEERSFTIIAYPVPQIGEDFEEIFARTVEINTLDYEKYKKIQQCIIDTLDGSSYVVVKGRGSNCTDMKVSLMQLHNPKEETVFENCLADVNIPLGEVFTSPVLKGTSGILNVSEVYLNDLKFKNLTVEFEDGMIKDYNCDNFDTKEANKAFIKETVLFNHDTLPLGEFAIGTNTTAYVMAHEYDIVYKLPILIVEKMGPHFAVGDTCYSWAEDTKVYNPDGKEIIARDNEVSLLRREDVSKAYYNCHTDITIPYDEIGEISAVKPDGTVITIIENGRFVLEGTKELNKPFEK